MSPRIPVSDGLQIDDDQRFERRDWRAQRIGWTVMVLVILAALAGGLGRGPLSARTITLPAAGQLSFDRVTRHGSTATLKLRLDSPAPADTVRVALAREFVDGIELRRIEPEPERTVVTPDAMNYVFGRGQGGPLRIVFIYEPVAYWDRHGWIRVHPGPPVRFEQFVLP